jgi:AraC-like DNA-binding protein
MSDRKKEHEAFFRTFYSRIQSRLQDYFSSLENRLEHDPTTPADDVVFVQQVNAFIDENMSNESFKIKDLCNHLAISPSVLSRRLKHITDLATGSYIRSFRLHRAKTMVMHTRKSMGSIALETGFADQMQLLEMLGVKS